MPYFNREMNPTIQQDGGWFINTASPFDNTAINDKPLLIAFVCMVASLPLYVLPSGGFNIADVPMLLLIGHVFLTHRKSEMAQLASPVATLVLFLVWALYVNLCNYLTSQHILCVMASLQLFYTALVFIALSIFLKRALVSACSIKYIYLAILISSITPLTMKGPASGFMARQSLSFPNPNQLAYFAQALIAAILILNYHTAMFFPSLRRTRLVRSTTYIVFGLCHFYILLAASRAGLTGVAYLDILALWTKRKLMVAIIIALALLLPSLNFIDKDKIAGMKLYRRLAAGDVYEGISERTQERFNFDDLSFVFGGGKSRRSLDEKKARQFKEVHNTLGDIVYSYGLIGGLLFCVFLAFYFRACMAVKYYVLILFSFIPVHITHNLIRFRLMWVLYAMTYSACIAFTSFAWAHRSYSNSVMSVQQRGL